MTNKEPSSVISDSNERPRPVEALTLPEGEEKTTASYTVSIASNREV